MALTISLNAKTATTITIDLAGRTTGTYDTIQFQYCVRPDFSFSLAPIADIATAAQIVLQTLNQGNTYFIRAREKASGSGAVGPWTAYLRVYTPISVAQSTTPLSVMIQPAIIVVPEDILLVANTPNAAYPADNLLSDSPNEQCWTTGSIFKFDTSGAPIDTLALLGTNISASATWYARGFNVKADRDAFNSNYTASEGGGLFQASSGLPGRRGYHGLMRFVASHTEPYWFFQISGGTPPGNNIVATYCVVGLARTAKNIAADKVEAPTDYGNLERTRDGVPDRRYGWRGRKVDFEIALMTEAQWETQFADLRWKIGLTDPVLVVPNTRASAFLHDRILYGPITQQRATQPYAPRFTYDLTCDSLI
jgi:hypothetical protein